MGDKEAVKLNLLDTDLDEQSQKYIQETLESWKESVTNQLMEEVEQIKAEKLEELEEENQAYKEELKSEYADKMIEGLQELKESVKADVTASVIKENPEIKILEQIKDIIAPLISEDYRDSTYEDTISKLSEENEALKHEQELNEGAKTLANLLAPYNEKTQKLVLNLIHEGTPEEVTEQFYQIFEGLEDTFSEEGKEDDKSDDDESDDDESDDDESDDDETKDDKKKKAKKDDESDDDESDDDESDDDDETKEESYVEEGLEGDDNVIDEDTNEEQPLNSIKNIIKAYTK
jgi:hypothetical protein